MAFPCWAGVPRSCFTQREGYRPTRATTFQVFGACRPRRPWTRVPPLRRRKPITKPAVLLIEPQPHGALLVYYVDVLFAGQNGVHEGRVYVIDAQTGGVVRSSSGTWTDSVAPSPRE